MFFLGERLLRQLIRAKNLPFLIAYQRAKSSWIVDKIIQVSHTFLANIKGYLDDAIANRSTFSCPICLKAFTHFSHKSSEPGHRLGSLKLLRKVLKFFRNSHIVATGIEGVNVDIVKPNEVLERVSESHLSCYGSSFVEVIHDLVFLQSVCVDVLGAESPFKVEARRVRVLILNPVALFERPLHITIASHNHKDFRVFVHSVLLLPSGHISNFCIAFRVFGHVSLDELGKSCVGFGSHNFWW